MLELLLPALIGGAFNLIGGAVNKPDIPKNPSFGGGAYGAQNPAVMQMLQALMGQQAQGQAQNQAAQQQALQMMLMAMLGQSQGGVQLGQPRIENAPPPAMLQGEDPLASYLRRHGM